MTIHDLKTWPEPFAAVVAGDKTHEARKNDRDYQVGDVLRLREFKPMHSDPCRWNMGDFRCHRCGSKYGEGPQGTFTGREVLRLVTYITPGGQYGLPADLCVMSIRKVDEPCPHPDSDVMPLDAGGWLCTLCGADVPAPADAAEKRAAAERHAPKDRLQCGACSRGSHAACSGWCRCGCPTSCGDDSAPSTPITHGGTPVEKKS